MTWSRLLLVPLVLAILSPAANAGLFSRKPKTNPAERVPELLIQLKTNQDEGQRTAAAEELRQYDPKAFPEIVTGLIDALAKDASPAVRSEAASSLGHLRPISQQAGFALEQAQNNDSTMRVRLAARQSLWQYHLVGYRGGKANDGPGGDPANSAGSASATQSPQGQSAPRAPGQFPMRGRETVEPPLAVPSPAATPAIPVSRPMPGAPTQLIPVNPGLRPVPSTPSAPTAPSAPVGNDGPALPPPA